MKTVLDYGKLKEGLKPVILKTITGKTPQIQLVFLLNKTSHYYTVKTYGGLLELVKMGIETGLTCPADYLFSQIEVENDNGEFEQVENWFDNDPQAWEDFEAEKKLLARGFTGLKVMFNL